MRTTKIAALAFASILGAATLMSGAEAKSDGTNPGGGTAAIYGNIPRDQIEFLSTPERIISVTSWGSPSAIWEALEHGEAIECLNCISAVAPLIYDNNAEVRGIRPGGFAGAPSVCSVRARSTADGQRREGRPEPAASRLCGLRAR